MSRDFASSRRLLASRSSHEGYQVLRLLIDDTRRPQKPVIALSGQKGDIVGIAMASAPLRDVPDDVMQHYTDMARREGVSRNAVLVRVLTDAARREQRAPLTPDALRRSAGRAQDLSDPAVMADAWS